MNIFCTPFGRIQWRHSNIGLDWCNLTKFADQQGMKLPKQKRKCSRFARILLLHLIELF